jgi:hypothetical protein
MAGEQSLEFEYHIATLSDHDGPTIACFISCYCSMPFLITEDDFDGVSNNFGYDQSTAWVLV